MERFNVVVGAVVVEGGSVLLLQRSEHEAFLPGVWGIPAGKASYGEPLHDAAVRELREEAGLSGKVDRLSGSSWFESRFDGDLIRSLQVNFVIRVDKKEVRLDRSNQDYRWLKIDELGDPPIPIDEFTLRSILQALNISKGAGTEST